MAPSTATYLDVGPLQLRVLEVMWAAGTGLTVSAIHETISAERKIAYTTVLTVARNLAKRGLVTQTSAAGARRHLFTPTQDRDTFVRGASLEFVSTYFGGSSAKAREFIGAL